MIPTEPGSYEFKGVMHSISEYVPPTEYNDWSRAEVYVNEDTKRLCARVFDHDGHYSASRVTAFSGEWCQPSFVNHV